MARRICAKVETYEKDGETKGKYVEIGVILTGENGDYALLDPAVNLAGVLVKQRIMNPKKGGKSIICSIFDNEQQKPAGQQAESPPAEFDDDIPFAHAWLVPAAGLLCGLMMAGQYVV